MFGGVVGENAVVEGALPVNDIDVVSAAVPEHFHAVGSLFLTEGDELSVDLF